MFRKVRDREMSKPTISVVIHTYNSEKHLRRAIESVLDADEIIICDMESTDNTLDIAKEYDKCKIFCHENVGMAEPARNFANSQVTSDYLLVLDSDEYASKAFIEYVRDFLAKNPNCSGLMFAYKNEILGKILRSYSKGSLLRIFKRGCVNYAAYVHAAPEVAGEVVQLPPRKDAYVVHTMVDDLNEHILKWNKYTTMEVDKMVMRNKKFSVGLLLFRPLAEFFKIYILKGGILDGVHGFIFAVIAANYKFMAIVKFWEYGMSHKEK